MNKLFFVFALMLNSSFLFCQLEDFEGEPLGGTTFTVNGVLFNVTGDFLISQFTNFSCGATNTGLNRYLDTGAGNGGSSGVVGSFVPNDPNITFQVSTSAAQCAWTGQADGNNNLDGTIRVTGTKVDNTTISEDFFIDTTIPDDELVPFTFSAGIWGNIDLKSIEFELISPAAVDYLALDEFQFVGVALPVELITFEGYYREGRNILEWSTASELNNEKFEIEESQDGREFQKVGEVKGTTFEQQAYSFEIENPRNGISYYRLKQIDFDGQFEFSEVIIVNVKGENGEVGEFYPNPSKLGLVNLDYVAQNDYEITVSVFDMTGKLVINQIQSISKGNNNLSFDFSGLNTGIYIVKFGDEINPTHRKLIIER